MKKTEDFNMLDMSTAHLSSDTRERLDKLDIEGVLYYPKGPWGWFVNVPTGHDAPEITDEVPADLKRCMHFAQNLNKEWIMFDCDGVIVDGLLAYEDENANNHPSDSLEKLAQQYSQYLIGRFERNFKATVTGTGKIFVKDDLENGMYAILSPEFVKNTLKVQAQAVECTEA